MSAKRIVSAAVLAGLTLAPNLAHADDRSEPLRPRSASQLPVEGDLPAASATEWLNSQPLTGADLRGKVVLIDFWTYSCINWRRTLPYLRAWSDKYKDQGLVVIGVHTPEFEFEKNIDNVRRAVKDMGIQYPVAIDSDAAVWRAFKNDFWPALYFVDGQGHIRHHYLGEGEYDRSERIIQRLLAEAGKAEIGHQLVSVRPIGPEVSADLGNMKSPETYVGFEKGQNFASPGGGEFGTRRT